MAKKHVFPVFGFWLEGNLRFSLAKKEAAVATTAISARPKDLSFDHSFMVLRERNGGDSSLHSVDISQVAPMFLLYEGATLISFAMAKN